MIKKLIIENSSNSASSSNLGINWVAEDDLLLPADEIGNSSQIIGTVEDISNVRHMIFYMDGSIMSSNDGDNYNIFNSDLKSVMSNNSVTTLAKVVFNNTIYLAISNLKKMFISTDGINWTFSSGINIALNVTTASYAHVNEYTNEIIIAGNGTNKPVFTTNDGVNFKILDINEYKSNGNASVYVNDIIYGNNVYLALGGSATEPCALYSYDLDKFYNATELGLCVMGTAINSAAFGNGVFVVNSAGGKSMYSTDGIKWNTSSNFFSLFNSVSTFKLIWTGSYFITFFTLAGNYIGRSVDGITWEKITLPGNITPYNVVTANDKILITSNSNATIFISSDHGATWTGPSSSLTTAIGTSTVKTMSYNPNNNMYLIGTGTTTSSLFSYDFVTWTTLSAYGNTTISTSGAGASSSGSVFVNNRFYVFGNTCSTIGVSTDGINWSKDDSIGFSYPGLTSTLLSISKPIIVNNRIVLSCNYGILVFVIDEKNVYEHRGLTKSLIGANGTVSTGNGVSNTYANLVINMGTSYDLLYSSDGLNWLNINHKVKSVLLNKTSLSNNKTLYNPFVANNIFFLNVGSDLIYSINGYDWLPTNFKNICKNITYNPVLDVYILFSMDTKLYVSSDKLNWTLLGSRTSATNTPEFISKNNTNNVFIFDRADSISSKIAFNTYINGIYTPTRTATNLPMSGSVKFVKSDLNENIIYYKPNDSLYYINTTLASSNPDMINWTLVNVLPNTIVDSISYIKEKQYFIGIFKSNTVSSNYNKDFYKSTDGITWTRLLVNGLPASVSGWSGSSNGDNIIKCTGQNNQYFIFANNSSLYQFNLNSDDTIKHTSILNNALKYNNNLGIKKIIPLNTGEYIFQLSLASDPALIVTSDACSKFRTFRNSLFTFTGTNYELYNLNNKLYIPMGYMLRSIEIDGYYLNVSIPDKMDTSSLLSATGSSVTTNIVSAISCKGLNSNYENIIIVLVYNTSITKTDWVCFSLDGGLTFSYTSLDQDYVSNINSYSFLEKTSNIFNKIFAKISGTNNYIISINKNNITTATKFKQDDSITPIITKPLGNYITNICDEYLLNGANQIFKDVDNNGLNYSLVSDLYKKTTNTTGKLVKTDNNVLNYVPGASTSLFSTVDSNLKMSLNSKYDYSTYPSDGWNTIISDIVYKFGKYFAILNNYYLTTSYDGIVWEPWTNSMSIIELPDKLIILLNGDSGKYTIDGNNWVFFNTNNSLYRPYKNCVTTRPNLSKTFVVNTSTKKLYYTTDGINYTEDILYNATLGGLGTTFNMVIYLNNKILVLIGTQLYYNNDDGGLWNLSSLAPTGNLLAVDYFNGAYYIASDKGYIYKTTDLVNFTTVRSDTFINVYTRVFLKVLNNTLVHGLSYSSLTINASSDGTNWTPLANVDNFISETSNSIVWNIHNVNNKYFLSNSGSIYLSNDFATFTRSDYFFYKYTRNTGTMFVNNFKFKNETYIVYASDMMKALPDNVWESVRKYSGTSSFRNIASGSNIIAAACSDNEMVLVLTNGSVYSSPDGVIWTQKPWLVSVISGIPLTSTAKLFYVNNKYILSKGAAGVATTTTVSSLTYSDDKWNSSVPVTNTTITGLAIRSVVYDDVNKYVMLASDNKIYKTEDFVTFTVIKNLLDFGAINALYLYKVNGHYTVTTTTGKLFLSF